MNFHPTNRPTWYFLLLALILMLGLARPAFAQENVVLETVHLDVWPEYDQPSVLVMANITLSSEVTLPAEMSIRLPASVGRPHAVAMKDPNGLYNLNAEVTAAGEWIEVKFTAPVPEIRIEYYDPELVKNGAQRDYVFRWANDYTTNNLEVLVQQPVNATNMTFRPDSLTAQQSSDGLTYYAMAVGQVNAGTPVELAISYQKPDDTLTSTGFQPAAPSQPVTSETDGRVTPDQILPWVVGGLGLLLIAGGIFWYWRTGHPATAKETGRRRHTSASARPTSAVSTAEPVAHGEGAFCAQCGKKAAPGDVFCRACGTKLR